MNLLQIHWNAAPEIINFTETYGIRWYGLLFAMGYLLSYFLLKKIFLKESLSIILLEKITMAAIVGGVVGARLGHCIFYEPDIYLQNPISILYVWKGGLASHGGAIGILLAFWITSVRNKVSFIFILSRAMIVVPIAAVTIRLGNLMNSEIYGLQTDLPWGFVFHKSVDVLYGLEPLVPRHPTQIYEALAYALTFVILIVYTFKQLDQKKPLNSYFIMGVFLLGIFLTRFFIEFIKNNQVDFEENLILDMGQILSIPFILGGVISLIIAYKSKNKHVTVY